MNGIQKIMLACALLALALIFGCSSDEGDGGGTGLSSSSIDYGTSSSGDWRNIIYGDTVIYQDETYPTVVIGTQTWFAKNLNYNVSGSVCYDNKEDNCEIYGRLYDWVTAMDFESSCSFSPCASQANIKYKGICPTGWHVPSDEEWSILINYADSMDDSTRFDSRTAGWYLKANSGWSNYGNGDDNYGFAALPGGIGNSRNGFTNIGFAGYWWSTTEYNALGAYNRIMYYNGAFWNGISKSYQQSVRCLKD